ncbi:MAG: PDZ domain-containing protein [Chloroflexia bacterium]
MRSRSLHFAALLLTCAVLAACDSVPVGPTPTPVEPASSPPTAQGSATVLPVAQGWIFTLDTLKESKTHRLDLDVLSSYGWPVGAISLVRGQNYEKDGEPDLINTVQLVTKEGLILELAASNPLTPTTGSNFEIASKGGSYEKSSPEGWRVRTSVRDLAVDEHPRLRDGATGPAAVFSKLDLDVEILGTGASPYLGFTADDVTPSRAALENLRGADLNLLDHGIVVREVAPGGPAAKAGLRTDDVVLAINGKQIDEQTPLSVLLSPYKAGDTVSLDVERDAKTMKLEVTLGARP